MTVEESSSEVESPPPAKKKKSDKPSSDVEERESSSVNPAPPPLATAGVKRKRVATGQRKATSSKGQKKIGSEVDQPVVYYPKALGYASGDKSASGDESSSSSEEEEWQPSAQRVFLQTYLSAL